MLAYGHPRLVWVLVIVAITAGLLLVPTRWTPRMSANQAPSVPTECHGVPVASAGPAREVQRPGRERRKHNVSYHRHGRECRARGLVGVSSGSDAAYTVALGKLTPGVMYMWTAKACDTSFACSAYSTEPHFVSLTEMVNGVLALPDDSGGGESANGPTFGEPNPWGCRLVADKPHPSGHDYGYIAAHSRGVCATTTATSSDMFNVIQYLYRSSYNGWRYVSSNSSWCDSETFYGSDQSRPVCNSGWTNPRLRATVRWDCYGYGFQGTYYNYRQVSRGYLYYGGKTYRAEHGADTGSPFADGTIRCG
jgi:hypothetical protein